LISPTARRSDRNSWTFENFRVYCSVDPALRDLIAKRNLNPGALVRDEPAKPESISIIHHAGRESKTLVKVPLDARGEALADVLTRILKALTEGSCPNRNE
jgi:hypothetical protein